jgi:hypothetical protein
MSKNLNKDSNLITVDMRTKKDLTGNDCISDFQFELCFKKGNEIYFNYLEQLQKIRNKNGIFNAERFDLSRIYTFFVMNHVFDSMEDGLWKFDENIIYHSESTGLCQIRTTKSYSSGFLNENIFDVGFEACYYQLNNMLEDIKMSKTEAIASIGYSILADRIPEADLLKLINYFSKKDQDIEDSFDLSKKTRISKTVLNKEILQSLFVMEDYELDFYTRDYGDYLGPRYESISSWEYFLKQRIPIFIMKSILYFIAMVGLKDLVVHWTILVLMVLGHLILIFGALDKFLYNYYIEKVLSSSCWSKAIPKFQYLSKFNGTKEVYINALLMGDFRHISVSTKPDPEMITLCKMTLNDEKQTMKYKYKSGYELLLFLFSEKIVAESWILSEYTNNTNVYDLEFYTIPFEYRAMDTHEMLALKASITDLFDVEFNLMKNHSETPISKHKSNAITSCINKFKLENNIYFKGQISHRFDSLYEKFKKRIDFLIKQSSQAYPIRIDHIEVPFIEFTEKKVENYDFEIQTINRERIYLDELESKIKSEFETEEKEMEEVEWDEDDYEDIEEVSDEEIECLNAAEEKYRDQTAELEKSRANLKKLEDNLHLKLEKSKQHYNSKIKYFEPKFYIEDEKPKIVFSQDCSHDQNIIKKALFTMEKSKMYNLILRSLSSIFNKIPQLKNKNELQSIKSKLKFLIKNYEDKKLSIREIFSPAELYDKLIDLLVSETKIRKQSILKVLKISDKKHFIQKNIVSTYKKILKTEMVNRPTLSGNKSPFKNENNIKLFHVFNLLRSIMPFDVIDLHPQLLSALKRNLFKRDRLKIPSNYLKVLPQIYTVEKF